MSVQQLVEHLMELGIKPHQNKTADEAAYNWTVTTAQALDLTASLRAGKQRKDGLCSRHPALHSCHSHHQSAQAHTVTFSSSINPSQITL